MKGGSVKTRREFLKFGTIGLTSLASFLIPGKLLAAPGTDPFSDLIDKLEGTIAMKIERKEEEWILRAVAMQPQKGFKALVSGKAVPYDKKRKVKFFSCGIDLDRYDTDIAYTKEFFRRINHNVRVSYKYS
jgi:hypothetical protein